MAKISLAGFRDPVRRPRYIIWTGVVVLLLAVFVVFALGMTSTRWFCAEVCHKVQDDTIIAYQHSSHNKVSCMACHEPAGADPITFVLMKMKSLGELYLTATGNYELPLNGESHLAQDKKHMGSTQCTQCHSDTRVITASAGIIIDHKVHEENEIQCTICHNRVAHKEDFELTLKDPKTGEPNRPHADFMKMTACFRCHGLGPDAKAPGACSACHTPDFPLKPEGHLEKDFYPKGHAEQAKEMLAEAHAAEGGAEGEAAAEASGEAEAEGEGEAGGEEGLLPSVESVFYCNTCHTEQFCTNCHGMAMPHDEEFKTKSHPELVKTKLDKCEFCHHQSKSKFCDDCHHGTQVQWTFNDKTPWGTQHAAAVTKSGVDACLGKCHEQKFCSDCHAKKKPFPSSHKAGAWLRKAGSAIGTHAENAKANVKSCEICHGSGGAASAFCKGCHKLAMPHPEEFKKFHAATGRKNPVQCRFCHTYTEVCSNCHHEGANNKVPWTRQHPRAVADKGSAPCFEKCHKADFCSACHTRSKVVPASHKAKTWTKDATSKNAIHTTAYEKTPDNCTFCHGKAAPEANKFCKGCHKLPMPHPTDFKDAHKDQFKAKTITKPMCVTCHAQVFCNKCHHEGYNPAKGTWIKAHQFNVKEVGAEKCFECHSPTYCSYCHVRQIH